MPLYLEDHQNALATSAEALAMAWHTACAIEDADERSLAQSGVVDKILDHGKGMPSTRGLATVASLSFRVAEWFTGKYPSERADLINALDKEVATR